VIVASEINGRRRRRRGVISESLGL